MSKKEEIKIRKFIEDGISRMLDADEKTLSKRPLLETSERNITAHLRGCLAEIGFCVDGKKYQIDHEYNRVGVGDNPKCLNSTNANKKPKLVIPDILVHFRGIIYEEDLNSNCLVIEVKKIKEFDGSIENIGNKKTKSGLEKDLKKLEDFRKDEEFRYQHIASIVFGDNKENIWISLDDNVTENKFEKMEFSDQKQLGEEFKEDRKKFEKEKEKI